MGPATEAASLPDDGGGSNVPLNRNFARRDELLGTIGARYSGGIKHFSGLDLERFTLLLEERFLEPGSRQNASPTAAEFLRFMRRWPAVRAHGYAVSRRRPDYRVSIEGLECDLALVPAESRDKLRGEFAQFCRGADEYEEGATRLYAWWD